MKKMMCAMMATAIALPLHAQMMNFSPDRLVVKMKAGENLPHTALVKSEQELFDSVYVVRTDSLFEAERFFMNQKGVAYVQRDYIAAPSKLETADYIIDDKGLNDERIDQQYSLKNVTEGGMSVLAAYDSYPRVGEQVIVAVIDTGVEFNHPDLAANMWTNPNEIPGNGIDDDNNGYIDDIYGINTLVRDANGKATMNIMDGHGHGTHVSGIIAAVQNNARGVAGVARNAKIMAIRTVPNSADEKDVDVSEAMVYAAKMGAKVINCSFGKRVNEGGNLVSDTMKYIHEKFGVLVVVAAGNDSKEIGPNYQTYPAIFPNENMLVVASSTQSQRRSYFSNYSATLVDVASPGSSILSTYKGGAYSSLDGTSMASPNTAGVAAEILSQYPQLTNLQVKQVIMDSVAQSPVWATSVVSKGRVDLKAALDKASSL